MSIWCEHCRDHYPTDHYPNGTHLVGSEYGPAGAALALRKAAQELYDDAGVDDIDQRLDYLVLQVSRDAWNNFVAAVEP